MSGHLILSFSRKGRRDVLNQLCLAVLVLAGLLFASATQAAVTVTDDRGSAVTLKQPARRIVSLSPHGTELLFAAGAGRQVVGAVAYSDYPPAAEKIPRVGGYNSLDWERIVALEPDLVVAWHSGNGPDTIARLRTLGLTVYVSEPRALEDIPDNIERLGRLSGHGGIAAKTGSDFRRQLQDLEQTYAHRTPVTVFYQVWHQPLMTIGGPHLISRLIELCGGRNIFAGLDALAPAVSVEAVLARDPRVIIASGMGEARPEWLDDWRRWPGLRAVRHGQLHFVPPDLLQRPTPRLLEGAARLCMALDEAREAYAQ